MTDTIDVAALVERRELTVEQKEACGYLAHHVLGGDGFTSDHARTLLALLADFERHHKSARTALQSQADALAEARRELAEARLTIGRLYEMMPEDGK